MNIFPNKKIYFSICDFYIYNMSNYIISSDITIGKISISENFDIGPTFSKPGDTFTRSFINLENINNFKSFSYSTINVNNTRYLTSYYRISRDFLNWSDWLELNSNITNFPPFDPKDTMFIDIKWVRDGININGIITLTDYTLSGNLERTLSDGQASLNPNNRSVAIKPPFIFKVFKINDIEVISDGDFSNIDIKYRFSQDYGRTVNEWQPFNKENITSVRINPIRFFQIEYLITYNGNNSCNIYDINLIGDFQNVTLDSQLTNLYGTRQNCNCLMLNITGGVASEPSINNLLTSSGCDPNLLKPLTPDQISKLYNPYQQTQAVNFLSKLSTDANQVFGHEVLYFITDPDRKGIDYSFHEYQLYNYVCSDIIKVSVDGNNFPDNQITMNQFDLALFETFEIHIPKDTFKSIFGVEKRPSKEDFLWFCEVNRMFQVEHAQQFRNFNNSALYYKIMLKKYSQKSNIIGVNQTISDRVSELTKNSTIDELFNIENSIDKKETSNQEQFRTLTDDVLRLEVNVDIDKEFIENSTTIISKNNYDLSTIPPGNIAILYRNFRRYFKSSDNISYFSWFNMNNYIVNDVYNFINYYDNSLEKGFKINLKNDSITLNLNSDIYKFKIGTEGNALALEENVWYCYLINIDQKYKTIEQWIYKRNVDQESDAIYLGNTILKQVYYQKDNLSPVEFELEDNIDISITSSDMKITNIRLFNDVIPYNDHNKILNQYNVSPHDYRNIIFSDSANQKIVLPNLPINQLNKKIIRGEVYKEDVSKQK